MKWNVLDLRLVLPAAWQKAKWRAEYILFCTIDLTVEKVNKQSGCGFLTDHFNN